ncbi:recombination-associated protein RdgC [Comamonas sediminis]|uniref:Recombination-associated protein RdgC n=1 Tax=Comamonas sediminis TaxID=1783360 RepID=A0ABV4B092_9BURK
MNIYRISESWEPDLMQLDHAMAKQKFEACCATQEQSTDWMAPRCQSAESHGAPEHRFKDG